MTLEERHGEVTFKGTPITLLGPELGVGNAAPGFTAVSTDLSDYVFEPRQGSVEVLSAVPSLDEHLNTVPDLRLVGLSMDLPFAQTRWAKEHKPAGMEIVSDHRDAEFGTRYGVLIKQHRLLSRAIFVIGPDNRITYLQRLTETTGVDPDYDEVVEAVSRVG